MQRYQSAHDVLVSVREKLAAAATAYAFPGSEDVLQQVADLLSRGRGYSWIGIYLSVEDSGSVAQAESGANALAGGRFPESKAEMVVPVKIGTRTLGMIDVEGGRAGDLSRQERVLLGQVAAALAQYLTTGPGKLRRRHARGPAAGAESHPHKSPQPARPERSRAAAGEHTSR